MSSLPSSPNRCLLEKFWSERDSCWKTRDLISEVVKPEVFSWALWWHSMPPSQCEATYVVLWGIMVSLFECLNVSDEVPFSLSSAINITLMPWLTNQIWRTSHHVLFGWTTECTSYWIINHDRWQRSLKNRIGLVTPATRSKPYTICGTARDPINLLDDL